MYGFHCFQYLIIYILHHVAYTVLSNEVRSKKEQLFIIIIKSRNNHAGFSNHIVCRINKFQLYDPFMDPHEYPLYILKILNIRFYTGFSHCVIFVALEQRHLKKSCASHGTPYI